MMKLYNTLSKKVEDFMPRVEGKVNLFVCGPTVYDLAQIGNAKTYIQFDVLARTLRASGYETFYLQNITDIDDKIIARAKEKDMDWKALSAHFEAEYLKDMKTLNNTAVSEHARATDYIDDIIRQVQGLIDKKHAYKIEDGIYFEISTFPGYGKLSGRTAVEANDAQTRIDHSDEKRGWNDFCLWKFSKPEEPVWDAPFGKGRPGWHIEDTAITEHFFGPQYDIHGGAVDLIFPHHEAELTQMESLSGLSPFVSTWVHTGFLTIDGKRMGKSLGNFFTIRDVLEKDYDPMALRLFMLQAHYRSAINFSWENLDAAAQRLKSWQASADLRFQIFDTNPGEGDDAEVLARAAASILSTLQDDLNTPAALSEIDAVFDTCSGGVIRYCEDYYLKMLISIDELLGLNLLESQDITKEQKSLIEQRQKARDEKNWGKSDEIRDALIEQGLGLRDSGNGAIWYRL
jgi:cysteinyl-tRNA synthetase